MDTLIVSPDTSTVYVELYRAVLTDLTTESVSYRTEATMDCLREVSDGMISVECRHTNFSSYIQI
jgi:hypothetical protein